MSQNVFLEPFIVKPISQHLHTIILLHGRGSTGSEFADELFESTDSMNRTLRDLLPEYRWVFPCAQTIFSKTFQEDMSQWYDITSLTDPEQDVELQLEGMCGSVKHIRDIVDYERALVSTGKIILGGISQGFSIAVTTMLLNSSDIHTLVGFSSWLPLSNQVRDTLEKSTQNGLVATRSQISRSLAASLGGVSESYVEQKVPPVFLAHCANDDVVAVQLGQEMKSLLTRLGYEVTWVETAEGGHWINEPQAVDELVKFLNKHNS